MHRRAFIGTLAASLLPIPPAAWAQPGGKVWRIGLLLGGSPSFAPALERVETFQQGLSKRGYVEGKNLAIEYRWAEGKPERFPGFAVDLVRLKVDVIVAATTPAALAAKNATETLPIVMVVIADPVGSGLVRSLARPGGNVTGLSFLAADLGPKQLQLLKEVVPEISRVAVLWLPTNPGHVFILRGLEAVAPTLRVTLQRLEIRGPEEFEGAFAAMSKERAGGLIVLPEPLLTRHGDRLAELAAKHRMPAVYGVVDHVSAGGLMAYAVDDRDNWRRAAAYVDMNKQQGHDGRFEGMNRVDVEDVPRLPTFPAAWTLADPRGRPYFVFWTSPLDDTLTRVLRMASAQQGAAVQVTIPDVGVFQIPIIRRPLPRRGGSRSSIGARAVPGRDATSTCAAWSSGGLSTIRATLPSMCGPAVGFSRPIPRGASSRVSGWVAAL